MSQKADRLHAALEEGARGTIPANVALMRVLIEARSPADIENALAGISAGIAADAAAAERLRAIAAAWRDRPEAWGLVRRVMAAADHGPAPGQNPVLGQNPVAHWAETFDRLATEAPDAGVALYALGDPDLLARATAEVVARLDAWGLIGPDRDAVDLGCGTGRFLRALAPLLRQVHGLDISGQMIAEARRRCVGLANVRLDQTEGQWLAVLDEASADLVLAVDVFPYLVLCGDGVAAAHVEGAARVLRPGGTLAILNYSYRSDAVLDRADVTDLACGSGLALRRLATGDFSLWDGATFLLDKPSGAPKPAG